MNIVHSLFMNLCYSVIIHDSINICAPRLRTCRIWPAMATNLSLISKTFWPEQILSSRLYPAQACICSLRLFRFAVVGGLVEASFSVGYVKSMNCFVSCSVIKVKNITQQIIMIFFRIEKANLGYPSSFDKPRIRRIMGGQGCQWGTSPGKNDQWFE